MYEILVVGFFLANLIFGGNGFSWDGEAVGGVKVVVVYWLGGQKKVVV